MSPETAERVMPVLKRIGNGDQVLTKSAKGAYQAFLGYYNGQMKRVKMNRKEDLVRIANEFSAAMGLHAPPAMSAMTVGKMGLKGVAGLNIGNDPDFGGGRNHASGGRNGANRPAKSHGGHSDGRRAPNPDRSRGSRHW